MQGPDYLSGWLIEQKDKVANQRHKTNSEMDRTYMKGMLDAYNQVERFIESAIMPSLKMVTNMMPENEKRAVEWMMDLVFGVSPQAPRNQNG